MHFGPWEFVAFGSLWIGAFMLAADVGVRMAPTLRDRIPKLQKIQETGWWAFTPLVLLTLAGGVFLYRALGDGLPQINSGAAPASFPTWAAFLLAFAFVVLLPLAFGLFLVRWRPAKPSGSNPTGRSEALCAPIIKIGIGTNRLKQAAPWLEFNCNAYNATGYNLMLGEVSGRVKIGNEEFHGQIEFAQREFSYPVDEFYNFTLRVPLSPAEAELCRRALATGDQKLEFVSTSITAWATSKPANSSLIIKLPQRIRFQHLA
jgi:hypothetical protein